MNRAELLSAIVDNVRKKHPHAISQDKYVKFFGELPREYINERLFFDNLLERAKNFKILRIPFLSETKLEVRLTLDQCIEWEIGRWEDATWHNILPNDIKKILKERNEG